MEIHSDARRGHIAVMRGAEPVITFTELGPVLHVWQHGSGVELSPEDARALGDALHGWADRRAARQVRAS